LKLFVVPFDLQLHLS